jgi:hypothetical protein
LLYEKLVELGEVIVLGVNPGGSTYNMKLPIEFKSPERLCYIFQRWKDTRTAGIKDDPDPPLVYTFAKKTDKKSLPKSQPINQP